MPEVMKGQAAFSPPGKSANHIPMPLCPLPTPELLYSLLSCRAKPHGGHRSYGAKPASASHLTAQATRGP